MPNSTTTPSEPAWRDAELAENPHAHAEKSEKVRRMFGAIAHAYDLNNRLHSFGRDQAWRKAAVRMAAVRPSDHVLDVACGTGDLTRAFADANPARVVGLDFTAEMLDIARTRRLTPARSPENKIVSYLQGDAMALPFDDASFDIVSIAFGIRNVAEPARALSEFRRILRPSGRLIVLEFSKPRFPPIRWMNDLYCNHIMPITASLIARDRSGAYRYLPRSIDTFLTPESLAEDITRAGFADIRQRPLTFGVCTITRAVVPN